MKSNHNVPTTWILLDNQATTDTFGNADLLEDIHKVTTPLHIHGITGVLTITQQGTLPGHGIVWYHPHVSVNILSMAKLKQQYHITYDSGEENAFIVKEHDNTQIKYIFHEAYDGLYYHDVNNTQLIYITTVTENKQKYSQSDVKRADGARALQKNYRTPLPDSSHICWTITSSQTPHSCHMMFEEQNRFTVLTWVIPRVRPLDATPQPWVMSCNNVQTPSLNNMGMSRLVLISCM